MRRRDFITLLGGAAAMWPLGAYAQRPLPVVGLLHSGSAGASAALLAAFRDGLRESGYVEGQNVSVEYRFAEGHNDRLPALAAELAGRNVAVLGAFGGTPSALAAKAATSTIPIVFGTGDDPIRLGLVASLNRPGGNITGVALFANALWPRCMEFLSEVAPGVRMFGALINPGGQDGEQVRQEIQDAAGKLGADFLLISASTPADIEPAFAALAAKQVGGLIVSPDVLFTTLRAEIVALAARHRMPTIYQWREYVTEGGLMSYGNSLTEAWRQQGIYVGRILHGNKPADLPGGPADTLRACTQSHDRQGAGYRVSAQAACLRRRGDRVRRRDFITLLGGGVAARRSCAAAGDAGDRGP
jgi:putative ABC transport system substrate-binding protein